VFDGTGTTYTKYRRFSYSDVTSGASGAPNLVGMLPNETRTVTMSEFQKSACRPTHNRPFPPRLVEPCS
jgi:hypothetical protein